MKVTELDRTYRSLEPHRSVQSLSEVFALYLTDYSDVGVYVESEKLNPSALIAERKTLDLDPIMVGDEEHAVQVELIEWKTASERWFFLCGPEGFPFQRTTPRFHTPGYQFSAYARHETRQKDAPPGRVFLSEDGSVEVWVKSWAEVLAGCKARLQFVQDHLQANVDRESSLRYLKKTYDKYLSGVADEHAMATEEIVEEASPAE